MSHGIKSSLIALIALGLTASVYALEPVPTAPITFDPQGTGGANGIEIGGFDWAVNSLLNVDSVPASEGADTFQVYAHTALQSATDAGGNPVPIPGLNVDFEITHIAGVNTTVNVTGTHTVGADIEEDGENFFHIYIDDDPATRSDALPGSGYADGTLILEGALVSVSSASDLTLDPLSLLDEFGADDWGGTTTVGAEGAQQVFILVSTVDADYFPDLEPGSLIPYSTETVLSFQQGNPSRNFDTFDGSSTGSIASNVGNTNGISGPDFLEQIDPNNSFVPLEPDTACRMTGGGNDTAGIPVDGTAGWDGTEGSASQTYTETIVTVRGKSGKVTTEEVEYTNVYTFGGQAGANTALQPQPKGERQHVNHSGPAGQWSFHIGTASAPPGTEIDKIICSDPGWCRQARPAPNKQIDYQGIGTFRNIVDIGNLNDSGTCATLTETKGKPSDRTLGTYNWAELHHEDRGEPGKEGQHTTADPASCPANGTGTDAFDNYFGAPVLNNFVCEADGGPDCPDFYRIRIYCGVTPEFDGEGKLSNGATIEAQKYTKPIYEVFGYIDGGNFQIHPLTGFDLR